MTDDGRTDKTDWPVMDDDDNASFDNVWHSAWTTDEATTTPTTPDEPPGAAHINYQTPEDLVLPSSNASHSPMTTGDVSIGLNDFTETSEVWNKSEPVSKETSHASLQGDGIKEPSEEQNEDGSDDEEEGVYIGLPSGDSDENINENREETNYEVEEPVQNLEELGPQKTAETVESGILVKESTDSTEHIGPNITEGEHSNGSPVEPLESTDELEPTANNGFSDEEVRDEEGEDAEQSQATISVSTPIPNSLAHQESDAEKLHNDSSGFDSRSETTLDDKSEGAPKKLDEGPEDEDEEFGEFGDGGESSIPPVSATPHIPRSTNPRKLEISTPIAELLTSAFAPALTSSTVSEGPDHLESVLNKGKSRKYYNCLTRPTRQFLHVDDKPDSITRWPTSAIKSEMGTILIRWREVEFKRARLGFRFKWKPPSVVHKKTPSTESTYKDKSTGPTDSKSPEIPKLPLHNSPVVSPKRRHRKMSSISSSISGQEYISHASSGALLDQSTPAPIKVQKQLPNTPDSLPEQPSNANFALQSSKTASGKLESVPVAEIPKTDLISQHVNSPPSAGALEAVSPPPKSSAMPVLDNGPGASLVKEPPVTSDGDMDDWGDFMTSSVPDVMPALPQNQHSATKKPDPLVFPMVPLKAAESSTPTPTAMTPTLESHAKNGSLTLDTFSKIESGLNSPIVASPASSMWNSIDLKQVHKQPIISRSNTPLSLNSPTITSIMTPLSANPLSKKSPPPAAAGEDDEFDGFSDFVSSTPPPLPTTPELSSARVPAQLDAPKQVTLGPLQVSAKTKQTSELEAIAGIVDKLPDLSFLL